MNETDGRPVACSLAAAPLAERLALWHGLTETALRQLTIVPGGVRLVFGGGEEVARSVRELAAAESECCAFARWNVAAADGATVLEVTAAGEGIAAVRAMFGWPEGRGQATPPPPPA
jgi:MerR family transcriptional regulator, copper efflux regulator